MTKNIFIQPGQRDEQTEGRDRGTEVMDRGDVDRGTEGRRYWIEVMDMYEGWRITEKKSGF